ncbi:MAG: hypothetical protein GY810_06720 [Aureispira sp.]|nr:hypothetical protein [Aureispira sp.]
MHKLMPFVIYICFLWACGVEQTNTNSTKKSPPLEVSDTTKKKLGTSLAELPIIAKYINEIGIPDEEHGMGKNISLEIKDGGLSIKNADEFDIEDEEIKENELTLSEGWYGTGGDGTNFYKYQLLENTEHPTLVCLKTYEETEKNYTLQQEDAYIYLQELQEKYPKLSKDECHTISWNMVERQNFMSPDFNQPLGYSNYYVNINVYQKKWQ